MGNHIFEYNGNKVTFQLGNGDVMVNATQMAKPFGKRVQHFLSTTQTNELLIALSQSRNLGFEQLVMIKKGGNHPGTWLHEDIALIFAQWLSPDFYLWCNDRIKELFKYGFTATDSTLDALIENSELGANYKYLTLNRMFIVSYDR